MELRTYWAVVWRWKWLALAVALVTFAASFTIQTREPTLYTATLRLAMRPNLATTAQSSDPAREQYYEYTTAEFTNDDIMEIVKAPAFHSTVTQRAAASLDRPVEATIDAKKAHKVLIFDVTADTPDGASAVAKAVADLLGDPKSSYFKALVSYDPTVTVVDDVFVAQATAPSKVYLYMLLRVALALVAGVGLAFLLEYLDDTVRSAREVEAVTGLAVLAEVPASGSAARPAPVGRAAGRAQTA